MGSTQHTELLVLLTKQPSVNSRPNKARNQTDEHSPEGLHEVVLFLVVGGVHVLGARKAHRFHVGEEHPVEEEAVVPVDDKPNAVTQRERCPEVVGTGQLHQSEHHGEGDEHRTALLEQHGLGEELRRHALVGLEVLLLDVLRIIVNPPYGILHEWNQDHDCKNGGHDESFNDDDGPVHSKSLVYNSLWIVQVLELYRNQNHGNDGNGKTKIIFPGQFFFEKKPTDEGGETDNTNVVNGE